MVELERRRRIRISLWAYAYEYESESLVSDAEFDKQCLLVTPNIPTGHPILDKFFRKEFSPHTGQWIHKHPELNKVKHLYLKMTGEREWGTYLRSIQRKRK